MKMTKVVKILTKCTTQRQTNSLFPSSLFPHLRTETPSYEGETYSLSGTTHIVKNDFILPTGRSCFSLTKSVLKVNCYCGCTSF